MRKMLLIAVMSIVSVVGIITPIGVSAQQGGGGFRISPLRNELTIERGQSETISINVRNVTSVTQVASANIFDFVPNPDESGSPTIIVNDEVAKENPYSLKAFTTTGASITLEPGQEANIDVTVSIPESASPGSYYGLVQIAQDENAIEEREQGGAVGLTASLGSLLLIQVPGDTVELVTLEELGVLSGGKAGTFFEKTPTDVFVRLNNTGNVFTKPFGKVSVKNWGGDLVYEYEINNVEPRGNILPGSIRKFQDPISGIGSFGRYTVETNISYGDGGSIITATTNFWVVPWKPIVAIIVVLVLVILGATRGVKAYNHMVLNRSKGERVKKK